MFIYFIFSFFEDLEQLCNNGNTKDVEMAVNKYSHFLDTNLRTLQRPEHEKKVPPVLDAINEIVRKAWAVPTYGHELGYSLCNTLRSR